MGIPGSRGWSVAAKLCDSCKSTPAAVFCRLELAFLCLSCDSKLVSRRERVWMCEVCEQAPAAVTCKADAAALCVSCDADIHSANPVASRHDRVPVEPFYDSAESIVKSSPAFTFFAAANPDDSGGACSHHEDVEASNWILPNPNFNSKMMDCSEIKPGTGAELFFPEMDSFLEFDYPNQIHPNSGNDGVVPVKSKLVPNPIINNNNSENYFDIDFCRSKLSSFGYPTQCLSQSVSSSSLDVGVVPDGNSISEISYSYGQNLSNNTGDPLLSLPASSNSSQATQACGIDREARVLRYREKRKNRKFEKTIRYASRKAYAETRPRIKGRFAKRTEIETGTGGDRIYGSAVAAFISDSQYGIVPSF
ncbi:hypothetical protein UlMin_004227 [Ulmus minor]